MCTVCVYIYIFNHPLRCYCITLPFYITTVSTGVHLHPRQLIQHHRHPGPKSWDITEENVRLSFLHYYQTWRAWLEDRLNLSPPGVGGIASPFLAGMAGTAAESSRLLIWRREGKLHFSQFAARFHAGATRQLSVLAIRSPEPEN